MRSGHADVGPAGRLGRPKVYSGSYKIAELVRGDLPGPTSAALYDTATRVIMSLAVLDVTRPPYDRDNAVLFNVN